ncbi:hypothetical protein A2716_03515 [candidate division WWE3 bacterium RIFCSPHIGHO2_01_FULL_40_23]|uniref:Cell envelope-related transcriptional attenuator domain-containing protein n=1 Tax=candidate division WWE3 bacterium RIFCSPLOWO2_01_FULL_41_18 TaxID=1802625 RepID=A0A1F4VD78_UNCKA|nr:MAG: hypothetical protein A2716_03515 [candidate division WWE3 bacterium RIFCSPHIGHO2_01_FULL_40_23]OGC54948.1 MAG: hypothetical protein A3A78_03125 [candidate division WWE3 bacterium RIFCSPLOWO2_01_FULL_41_18]
MIKKLFIITLLVLVSSVVVFTAYQAYKLSNNVKELISPTGSLSKKDSKDTKIPDEPTKVSKDKMFSVLLLGIDRRHKSETSFRTDIMILVSVNQTKKKVVFTSVPRDLWVNGGRINATYVGSGWPAMQDAFERITGQKPDAFIQSDFEDLVWIVDTMGGIDLDLETGFIDSEYPNDVTKTYQTVSFNSGLQHVDGRTALILSRSRHGNNGEGSDFKRMLRQHKILKAMPEAILSTKSLFNPLNVKKFYEMVTEHMVTDLGLKDTDILWSFYPQRNEYTVESFLVDSTFLHNPPLSEYGGAWVLVPINNDYSPIHTALSVKLGLIDPAPETIKTEEQP